MLKANQKLALFCEATMGQPNTKMAEGILRYGPNECVAVIDSKAAGKSLKDFWKLDTNLPIVGTLNEAIALGAEVLVLGTAPSGGRLPESWKEVILQALDSGLSVVNGLHDKLQPVFSDKLKLIWLESSLVALLILVKYNPEKLEVSFVFNKVGSLVL